MILYNFMATFVICIRSLKPFVKGKIYFNAGNSHTRSEGFYRNKYGIYSNTHGMWQVYHSNCIMPVEQMNLNGQYSILDPIEYGIHFRELTAEEYKQFETYKKFGL